MKLQFSDPMFVLFASEVLDETEAEETERTRVEAAPASQASPFDGLTKYASEVRIRAAVRAEKVAQRRRGA